MNASNISLRNSSHSPIKFSRPVNLTTQNSLNSVQSAYRTRASSTVTLVRSSEFSSLQITNSFLDMHHLTCGISCLLRSVNLILFALLLVHLILHTSPHHSLHLRCHHLSLTRPFTPEVKLHKSPVRLSVCLSHRWIS